MASQVPSLQYRMPFLEPQPPVSTRTRTGHWPIGCCAGLTSQPDLVEGPGGTTDVPVSMRRTRSCCTSARPSFVHATHPRILKLTSALLRQTEAAPEFLASLSKVFDGNPSHLGEPPDCSPHLQTTSQHSRRRLPTKRSESD